MTENDADTDLLIRVADGESEAVHLLLTRKLPKVLALASRMLGDVGDAEDVAQETFLRIWKHAGRWRKDGPAKFDTWLHKVVLNLCYDRLRRRRDHLMAQPPEQLDPATPADRAIEEHQMSARVQNAMNQLGSRQRDAILLHYHQGLSNIDAAAVLGVSVDALESLLSRGRRTLRNLLRGETP